MIVELPSGQPVEIEFISEHKPNQRGVLPAPIDFDRPGFELIALTVPTQLGFREPFRVEQQRKWLNLATVAEIRYLPESALVDELQRLAAVHQQVRERMERS